MNRREALLGGIGAAASLHDELGLRDVGEPSFVDVFGVISSLDVPLLFRPLDGLLGLFLPPPAGPGIMVTTNRSLQMQRFTAAHELGHHILEHSSTSFDERIGFVARGDYAHDQSQEIAADAFAAEFMLPRWLLVQHARKHRWGRDDLLQPRIVYQLSLRVGMSYEATCRALVSHEMVPASALTTLLSTPPKACKQSALGSIRPGNFRLDVWELTDSDSRSTITGGPSDIFVLSLAEHTSGGYRWDTSSLDGFEVLEDSYLDRDLDSVGAPVERRIVFRSTVDHAKLNIAESRSWEPRSEEDRRLTIEMNLFGAEYLPFHTEGIAA